MKFVYDLTVALVISALMLGWFYFMAWLLPYTSGDTRVVGWAVAALCLVQLSREAYGRFVRRRAGREAGR